MLFQMAVSHFFMSGTSPLKPHPVPCETQPRRKTCLSNSSIVNLPCCVTFRCTAKWFSYTHTHTHMHTHAHAHPHVCVYIFLFRFFSIRDCCKVLFLCSTVGPCWLSNSLVWIGFPDDSVVKNPHVIQEAQVWFLGWEYLLEEEMTILSSILAGKIPWKEDPGSLQSMGSQRAWCDWTRIKRTCKQCASVNPRLLVYLPTSIPFSNHTFAFYVCESVSIWQVSSFVSFFF